MSEFGQDQGNVHFSITQSGNIIHFHQMYKGGDAVVKRKARVSELMSKAMPLASSVRVEVAGPAEELSKIKEVMKDMDVQYFETFEPIAKDPLKNYNDPLEKFCEDNEDADEARLLSIHAMKASDTNSICFLISANLPLARSAACMRIKTAG